MDKDTIDTIIIYLIAGLVVVACLALTFTLSAWIFKAVMASDMPEWLKLFLITN